MLLVDTDVLLDVVERDAIWADWSLGQLSAQAQVHELAINPVIYAELSLAFATVDEVDRAVKRLGLVLRELPRPALFLAGRAFLNYRRQGGPRNSVLPDFFIGAQAAVLGCGILTRDGRRYRTHFPRVELVTPTEM